MFPANIITLQFIESVILTKVASYKDLHVFVVEEFQFDQDIRTQVGKPGQI